MSDGSVRDVIHWPESGSDLPLEKIHGGIPILFPFAGQCYHEGREGYWKDGSGEIRRMPCHGFAKDSRFAIRSIDQAGFEAELIQDGSFRENYPYEYTFLVIFHFLELSLQISLILENEGRTPIPWSAGLHPYFQVPWRKDLGRKDHLLSLDTGGADGEAARFSPDSLGRPGSRQLHSLRAWHSLCGSLPSQRGRNDPGQ
jgi:galactose mutarotase-like enzyme